MKNADTSRAFFFFFCTPAVGLRQSERRRPSLITPQSRSCRRPSHGYRAHVHSRRPVTATKFLSSLFKLQRRRVMTRQGALVKRTRKKNETWRTKGGSFEPSNLCELRACSACNPAGGSASPHKADTVRRQIRCGRTPFIEKTLSLACNPD